MDAPCHPPCHDRKTGAVPAVGDLSNRGRSADRGAFHQHRLRPGWEWGGLVWGSEAERPIGALNPALEGGKERVGHTPWIDVAAHANRCRARGVGAFVANALVYGNAPKSLFRDGTGHA